MTDPARASSPTPPPLVAAAVACGALSAAWLVAGDPTGLALRDLPLDDAWIHLVYVRGLVREAMPTYNPGVVESGFSSPLWLLASLPGYLLATAAGLPVALGAKLTSGLAGVAAALGLGRLARALGGGGVAALATTALFYLSPGSSFSAASGMEVTLALACAAAALGCDDDRPGRAGAWLAAATLARPECLALVPVLALARARGHRPGAAARRALAVAAPPALAVAAWALTLWSLTGHPLPNTFVVKAGVPRAWGDNLARFLRHVALEETPWHSVAMAALALAGWWWLRGRDPDARWRQRTLLAAGFVGVAGVLATRNLIPGPDFYQTRYFLPFSLLLLPFAACGLEAAWSIARRGAPVPRAGVGAACLALAAVLGLAQAKVRWSYRAHCREIYMVHTVPGLEIARNTPAGTLVAAEGAGSLRFHGDRPVLDLVGLNASALAHARGARARGCLIVRAAPAIFVIPIEWERSFAPMFALRRVRTYGRALNPSETVMTGVVVLDAAQPRPEAVAACALPGGKAPPR